MANFFEKCIQWDEERQVGVSEDVVYGMGGGGPGDADDILLRRGGEPTEEVGHGWINDV